MKDIERARVNTTEPTTIDRYRLIVLKNHIGKFQSNLLAFNLRKYFKKWKSKRHTVLFMKIFRHWTNFLLGRESIS